MHKLLSKKFYLIILIIIFMLLFGGIQIGSCSVGGTYFSSPKIAFEDIEGYDGIENKYLEVLDDIGIYKINEDYSFYFSILGYIRNDSIFDTSLSVMLMKTKDDKYYYMGSRKDFNTNVLKCTSEDEEKQVFTTFEVNGEPIDFCFARKEFFDHSELTDGHIVYNSIIDFQGEKIEITIAVETYNG